MGRPINAVVVVSGDIDSALKLLRKKIEKEGLVKEIKRAMYYEKPSQQRRKKELKAKKKLRKLQEKMKKLEMA
ncbi:MAG: 30S ribosomal protein S21 [Thermosulfidibacteraceae bacterium]